MRLSSPPCLAPTFNISARFCLLKLTWSLPVPLRLHPPLPAPMPKPCPLVSPTHRILWRNRNAASVSAAEPKFPVMTAVGKKSVYVLPRSLQQDTVPSATSHHFDNGMLTPIRFRSVMANAPMPGMSKEIDSMRVPRAARRNHGRVLRDLASATVVFRY
ncbi:hypothetical protein EV126DRAFT_173306 [Verticillium dahliae]|nr:hypothetical protein EV126DRAFT_173306 [Verticillium dahliae]